MRPELFTEQARSLLRCACRGLALSRGTVTIRQELFSEGNHIECSIGKEFTRRCSLEDNRVVGADVNYRAVWARDGSKTIAWTADLEDIDIRRCQEQTIRTILNHQGPAGQLPAHVSLDTKMPEYGGVGGITSIDSALWMFVAVWEYCILHNDYSLLEEYADHLRRAIEWLSALDANNCGMLEIPEAGDWTDLFARSLTSSTMKFFGFVASSTIPKCSER